jgi:hypothetical protein
MRQGLLGDRWKRTAAGGLAVLATAALAAGCGSSSKPAGLSGKQSSAGASKQETAEERQAATTLTPAKGSFLHGKTTVTLLSSTTPANGDINPYAIWPVSETVGSVKAGDVLVDNFNNKSNNQGTGTTIVDVHPTGKASVFAHLPKSIPNCPGGVGLTTAMVQLKTGWVIVGSFPSKTGTIATASAGCLIVLSPEGKLAGTIAGPKINGPWDETVADNGTSAELFVANAHLGFKGNGLATFNDGDVLRLTLAESASSAPKVTSQTVVASRLPERGDASVFAKGPTGMAVSNSGTLYLAENVTNRIIAIPDASTRTKSDGVGSPLSTNGQLSGPLGLTLAPDGDILVANGLNGKIIEIAPSGKQLGEYYADHNVGQDPPGNGDLFDVAVNQAGNGVLFVNDGTNTLELLH